MSSFALPGSRRTSQTSSLLALKLVVFVMLAMAVATPGTG